VFHPLFLGLGEGHWSGRGWVVGGVSYGCAMRQGAFRVVVTYRPWNVLSGAFWRIYVLVSVAGQVIDSGVYL
jgi:hypothetical protein